LYLIKGFIFRSSLKSARKFKLCVSALIRKLF